MRNASTQVVFDLIRRDRNVLAITADNRNEIFDAIRKEFPQQYIEYGIAEENMVASAAGLASCGKIPFLYTITNFMAMHAFEYIRNDVCVANQNVKFLGRSSGLTSSSMGPTHQGTEELAMLRTLPNIEVITPATPIEAQEATKYAYEHKGPVYIRLEGVNEPELFDDTYQFQMGKGHVLRDGQDICLIAMGSVINEGLAASKLLQRRGLSVRIIDMPTLNPIDEALILEAAENTRGIITLEEHSIYGGLGGSVAEVLAEYGTGVKLKRLGLQGCAKGCGNRGEMRELNCLDATSIVRTVEELLG